MFATQGMNAQMAGDEDNLAVLSRGRAVYLENCVACHGREGNGRGEASCGDRCNGAVRTDRVPPGTYRLLVWHETLGMRERTVTVSAQNAVTVNLELERQD